MSFWENKSNQQIHSSQTQEVTLDEQALDEVQGESYDVFEDDEEDTKSLMADADLRLEQGRLYQMVLQGNIFADTNADPRAIKNVQREIRKYVRERMETMLGIRQEQVAQQPIVSSPFNDLEVTALKMVASKVTKGATETVSNSMPPEPQASPKKDGISSISGNVRPNALTSTRPVNAPSPKPKTQTKLPAPKVEASALQKPIDQMTQEELAEHNRLVGERTVKNRSAAPPNMVPHPTPQQLEMMYTATAAQVAVANPVTRFRPY